MMKKGLLLILLSFAAFGLFYMVNEPATTVVEELPLEMQVGQPNAELAALQAKERQKRHETMPADGVRGMKRAARWLHQIRRDITTDEVNPADVINARRKANEMLNNQKTAKTAEDLELTWEELGPNNIGGRTRSLIVDKDDPQKLIAGSVAGGVWLSSDGGSNWTASPANSEMATMAIGCMTQAANGDIYAGTGEGYYFFFGNGAGGFPGEGIFKSTDGGQSFEQLEETIPNDPNSAGANWNAILAIASDPSDANKIYAASDHGLFVTSDGGESWDQAEDDDGDNISGTAYDVEVDVNGVVHAVVGQNYWRSTDNGDSFVSTSGNGEGELPKIGGRKAIAVGTSNPDYLYAAFTSNSCFGGIYRSTNGGDTWSLMTAGSIDAFAPCSNSLQCQCDYDFALAVHPSDHERVFIAGVSLWMFSGADNIPWTQIDVYSVGTSPLVDSNPDYVHADKHNIIFDEANPDKMYVVHDGGITVSNNSLSDKPTFQTRNKKYNVTQFYGVAGGLDGTVLGGTQDNGTLYIDYTFNSKQSARKVQGGDGGYTEISHLNPNIMFAATPNGDLTRSSNGGDSFGCFVTDAVVNGADEDENADCKIKGNALFISPFLLWENLELYYMLYDKTTGDEIPESDFEYTEYSFVITDDESEVDLDRPILTYEEGETISILSDAETGAVVDPRIQQARYICGSNSGRIFINETPLDLQKDTWYDMSTGAGGDVSAFGVSRNGNTLYVGSSNGRVARIADISDYYYFDDLLTDGDGADLRWEIDFEDLEDDIEFTTVASGRFISGIATDPTSKNKVYVSAGNYGNEDYVFYSENAGGDMDFDSLQEDLPESPVYDIELIRSGTSKFLIAATELGVFTYKIPSSIENGDWENQSAALGSVPVFSVRVQPVARGVKSEGINCQVIYVGTHGRGIFRSTDLSGCSDDQVSLPDFNANVGVEDITANNISIFPNPASDYANIALNIQNESDVKVAIYSPAGRIIMSQDLGNIVGEQQVQFDTSKLPAGTYIVALLSNGSTTTDKMMIVR